MNNLVISTIFQHNKGSMAYLDKGVNNITVTFDNPAELAASGAAFKVTYQWKEYDGTGWTIDKSHEQYVLTSPTTFTHHHRRDQGAPDRVRQDGSDRAAVRSDRPGGCHATWRSRARIRPPSA